MNSAAVDDRYPLSPMQQGMLYHTLAAPTSGAYCIRTIYTLHGRLDTGAFISAWKELVKRHAVLRTSFHWEDRADPVQVVHTHADLPVEELDWRRWTPSKQEARLKDLLDAEGRRGFQLTEPPLIRLSLIRTADETYEVVLVNHHLLLDGWCKSVLFQELFAFYDAFRQGRRLDMPLPRPYREYIGWLGEQDLSKAERFWREELKGFTEPTRLWSEPSLADDTEAEQNAAEYSIEVEAAVAEALSLLARRRRLTLNTIVQGMWAVILSCNSGSNDVVFGATASGRPPSLIGVESMVGLFINTLPVRVRVSPESSLVEWLKTLQLHQARARDYDYSSLAQIRRWSEVAGGQPLFDSIVVFENTVGFATGSERHGNIEISRIRPVVNNSLPLTLRCVPGPPLSFQILYDCRRFSEAVIGRIGEQVAALLRHLPQDLDAPVARLVEHLNELDRQHRDLKMKEFDGAILKKLRNVTRARPLPARDRQR